jgi:HEAT repeat protein
MLGDEVALGWLLKLSQDEKSKGHQMWAAEELGRVGGAKAMEALAGALRAPDREVLASAVRALAETSDPRGTHLLEEALKTADKKDGKVISRGLRWRKLIQSIHEVEKSGLGNRPGITGDQVS